MDSDDVKRTAENADEQDEKLNIENVDEQIEYYLSQSRMAMPENADPLVRVAHDLQSIYAEDRRLEQAWARINNHMSVPNVYNNPATEELPTIQSAQKEKQGRPATGAVLSHRTNKRSQRSFHWNWRVLGISVVAAMLLLTIFVWPIVSYALYGNPVGNFSTFIHKSTPQSQPTTPVSSMKEYRSQYFAIQYPADWVITRVNTGGASQQTVQLRPSATSAVFVNIDVLSPSSASADQLLQLDPDVKLGTRLNKSIVTYHGIPWTVGVVERTGSDNTQAGKLEVAYSNQGGPLTKLSLAQLQINLTPIHQFSIPCLRPSRRRLRR
ncbi:hypothetical protein [Dictyobacter kobayashii]|uniref:Uncharacterized protein n=1 Tax=Dictyobacter kobayashii TaxID=2014872 RepID=A0A402ALR2_9CHLR|nr:hypothetical protein [Dictyobacter kobayashii]GCE20138.1 hypothetical protein KDK_39380 [Dictyobacter kobayashii]